MVDYSKFHKIISEMTDSDDDDDNGEGGNNNKLKVTKLDKPTSITITPQQSQQRQNFTRTQQNERSQFSKNNITDAEEEEEHEEATTREDKFHSKSQPISGGAARPATTSSSALDKKTRKNLTINGSENSKFLWDQTVDEVHLRVICPLGTRAKDVQVVVSKQGLLTIQLKSRVFFEGKLAHGVWDDDVSTSSLAAFAKEEETFSKSLHWEMEDLEDTNSRCIYIRLTKKPLQEGLKQWWRTVFVPGSIKPESVVENEVDVTQIAGRSKEKIEQTQQVWKEAHQLFLQARARERSEESRVKQNENSQETNDE
jgi:hypothetical protein